MYECLDAYGERCEHRGHDVRPKEKGIDLPMALSVAQKEVIVKLHGTVGGRVEIAEQLKTSVTCKCTPAQRSDPERFKKAISNFTVRGKSKNLDLKSYLLATWHR